MSREIDEKIVSMQFDNKNFEKNVSTTMSTLEKLKQSLMFKDASKGFKDVEKASQDVGMTHLGKALDTICGKFSALGVMGTTVLANLTNSAVNAGKRMVSALTIDPIKTGFQEYETQMNSVQTILANTESKGSTLQDVNNALAELNTYADKTIYNFTEMTRNIGTFTAAGVDLENSVSSIQGIANLAAVSGSTSQQASTAMYQLSQALSSGTVKLMDWNSVVNAGMGGQVFQDALKRTATVMGTNVDALIKKHGSFRESLQAGWITADVLTETLNQFTMAAEEGTEEWNNYKKSLQDKGYSEDQAKSILKMANTATNAATKVKTFTQLFDTLKESAQSGWTKTWEILIGDFGEAKDLLTEISDEVGGVIGKMSDARNELLTGALSTGWKQLLGQGIDDAAGFEEMVTNVAKEHGIKLDEMINDETTFQDTLKDGWLNADILTESISKFSDKLSGMSEEEMKAAGYTQDQIDKLTKLNEQVQNGTISMEEFSKLISRPSGRELLIESLRNSVQGLMSVLKPIGEAFREIFPATTADQLYSIIERFRDWTATLKLTGEQAESLKSTFKGIFAVIDIVVTVVKELVGGAFSLIGGLTGIADGVVGVTGAFGNLLVGLRNTVKESGIIETVFGTITKALQKLLDILVPGANGIFGIFQKLFEGIYKFGTKIIEVASGIGSAISNMFRSGDMQAGAELFNTGVLGAILLGIKKFMDTINDMASEGGILAKLTGILDGVKGCLESWQQSIKADTLKKIATAVGILAGSLFVLAMIDPTKLAGALTAITVLFGELLGSLKLFDKMGGTFKNTGKAVVAMTGMAYAILILSAALKVISTLSAEELAVGLTGMTASLGALIGAVRLLPEKEGETAAKTIKKLASALLVLSVAIKIMSTMSWNELAVGLTAMVAGLGSLIGAMHLLPKDMAGKSAGMMGLATAMLILSGALKIMSTMTWDDVGRSLVTLAGSLIILVAAMKFMSSGVSGAAALLIISGALVVLSGALKIMATMSWEEIGKCMVTLAGSLILIAAAMAFMTGALPGAGALLVVSGALAILAPVLLLLSQLSWEGIAKGLVAIAGAFAIIGVAGLLLGPLSPVILALAGAIALLGVGCLAAGIGLGLIAAGISALAVALAGGTAAIVAGLSAIVMGLITLAGDIIVGICTAITNSVGAIGEAILALVAVACDVVIKSVPKILEALGALLDALFPFMLTYIPQLVDTGVKLIIALLDGIASNMGDVIASGVRVITEFLRGVGRETPKLIDAGWKMMIDFINGLADSCEENIPALMDAIGNLGTSIIDGLVTGITNGIGDVGKAFKNLALSGLDKFKSILGINSPSKEFIEQGCFIVKGLMKGLKDNTSGAVNASEDLGSAILHGVQDYLGIHSPSVVFSKEVGRYIVQGIADGIKKDMSAEEAAQKKAQNIQDAFSKKLNEISTGSNAVQKKYNLWTLTDGKTASQAEHDAKYLQLLNDLAYNAKLEEDLAYAKWQETIKYKSQLVDGDVKVQEAENAYLDAQANTIQRRDEITAYNKAVLDREAQLIEEAMSLRDQDAELWELNNPNATEEERNNYYLTKYYKDKTDAHRKVLNTEKDYLDICKKQGATQEEINAAKQIYNDAMIAEGQIDKQIRDTIQDNNDIEKQNLRDSYDIASERADLEYQIWEKTLGRKATDAEKDAKKLVILNQQLASTAGELAIAEYEWQEAVFKGKSENEVNTAYNKFLQAQLSHATLQGEILDIEEENAKREKKIQDKQKTAKRDYADYIKKYEKYYADHGMSRAELEKDAKLVSGYDPSAVINKTVSKTQAALNTVTTTVSNYATSISQGIQNGTSTVIDNTTTMIDKCVEAIDSKKEQWKEAGQKLVDNLMEGIKSKTEAAVAEAASLASSVLSTLESILNSDMDFHPTITPVLDMSNVSAGLSGFGTTIGSTSVNMASSIASRTGGPSGGTGGSTPASGASYNFTQINNSPKALSSTEIYRQTKNQISTFKKVVART